MKEKIKTLFKKIYPKIINFLSNIYNKISTKIKESFIKCRSGEENLNTLLVYWCLIPSVSYIILLRIIDCKLFLNILDLTIFTLSIFDFYFIAKTLKVHPEYNTELMKELEKQNLYKTLNKEELKEQKLKEKKENRKNFIIKFFSYKTKEKTDLYKIVRYFLIIVFLIAVKRIFL